jgi:hypothetical protein
MSLLPHPTRNRLAQICNCILQECVSRVYRRCWEGYLSDNTASRATSDPSWKTSSLRSRSKIEKLTNPRIVLLMWRSSLATNIVTRTLLYGSPWQIAPFADNFSSKRSAILRVHSKQGCRQLFRSISRDSFMWANKEVAVMELARARSQSQAAIHA